MREPLGSRWSVNPRAVYSTTSVWPAEAHIPDKFAAPDRPIGVTVAIALTVTPDIHAPRTGADPAVTGRATGLRHAPHVPPTARNATATTAPMRVNARVDTASITHALPARRIAETANVTLARTVILVMRIAGVTARKAARAESARLRIPIIVLGPPHAPEAIAFTTSAHRQNTPTTTDTAIRGMKSPA